MSLRKLAGETFIYGVSHILPRVLNFILMTPYLTYKFKSEPEQYALYSKLYAYSTIILALMVFRMDTAYFRYASKSDASKEREVYGDTFIIMAFISTIVFITLIILNKQIASWLGYPGQGNYIIWFSFILAFDAYTSLIYSRLRLQQRPYKFMLYRFTNVFLIVGGTLCLLEVIPADIKMKLNELLGIKSDMAYVFIANLIASMIVFIMMLPDLFNFKYTYDKDRLREILKYSLPLVVIIVAGSINQYGSALLQNYLLSDNMKESLIGIFQGSSRIAILLNLFTTAFNYAAEPFFFNQAKKDDNHAMNGVIAFIFTVFCCFVIIGLYGLLDLTFIIIPSTYRMEAVVPILLMSYLFLGLYYNVSIWYKLADKTKYGAYIAIGALLVTLVVSAVLIPTIGIIGSAWASLACFIFEVILGYYLGQKYFKIDYPVKKIITYIIITSIILVSIYLIRASFDNVWIKIGTGIALLAAFALYFVTREREFINKFVLKKA